MKVYWGGRGEGALLWATICRTDFTFGWKEQTLTSLLIKLLIYSYVFWWADTCSHFHKIVYKRLITKNHFTFISYELLTSLLHPPLELARSHLQKRPKKNKKEIIIKKILFHTRIWEDRVISNTDEIADHRHSVICGYKIVAFSSAIKASSLII